MKVPLVCNDVKAIAFYGCLQYSHLRFLRHYITRGIILAQNEAEAFLTGFNNKFMLLMFILT